MTCQTVKRTATSATHGQEFLILGALCRAGEEVTHTYNMDNERNDYALINYFFLQRLDQPRLCAIDLPDGHLDASFAEFDDHYLPRDKAGILVCPPFQMACSAAMT